MPFYYGRGLFNGFFGLLPHRRPITMVVGKPIPVEKCVDPTKEQIDDLHSKYVEAISELFETHKKDYGIPEHKKLEII